MPSVGDKRKLDDGGHTFTTCPTITKKKKVSAVRQFPSHCGPVGVEANVPDNEIEVTDGKLGESFKDVESIEELSEAVDKHFSQDENNANALKEVACVNEVSSTFEVGDSSHTEMEVVVGGKDEKMNNQVSQAQMEIHKVEGDDHERVMETRDCNGEDEENRRRSSCGTDKNEVYPEVKHKNSSYDPFSVKKENITSNVCYEWNSAVLALMAAPISLSRIGKVSSMSNVKQKGRKKHSDASEDQPNCVLNKNIDNVENLESRSDATPICPKNIASYVHNELKSVVLGLMAAPNCPWRNVKETAKSVSSMSNVKQNSRKKHGHAREDEPNCVPAKCLDNVENLEGRSIVAVPYLKETEAEEVYGINNDEDSSEDEDLTNDFVLMPRGHIDVTLFPSNPDSDGGVCRNAREILCLFRSVVRKLLQGEEITNTVGKLKNSENTSKRIDLLAADILKTSGKCVITGKRGTLGPIPGVEVGDFFYYRMELLITNLHRPLQGGIDFIRQGEKNIAISIVASGGYDNDLDYSDVLIYTGQGGNPKFGDRKLEDQKLERGNLALKNSIDEKNVVRVIQGFKETKSSDTPGGRSKTITTYTYDGLYTVEKYWPDAGPSGNLVYKFELRRIPGQPELVWKELKRSKKLSTRKGRCVDDISEGKEAIPISAVNAIDDDKPPPFTYITSMIYPDWCKPIPPRGCDCKDGCSDSNRCACTVKNGGEIPYNFDGAIIEAKRLVYECGPTCKCPPSCRNRVSQHGIKFPLEVFKTESRGWGVRSLSSIPSGSFICEYIGELLDDREADQRTGSDEYLFDIGQNYNDSTLWDGLPALTLGSDDLVGNIGFTIDAANFGNVGRFVNHSCSPNLYAQNVLYDHDDERIPHVMLFATENIPPLQELSYHYNYEIDKVFDSDGNIKKKSCHCGSEECTGRMY